MALPLIHYWADSSTSAATTLVTEVSSRSEQSDTDSCCDPLPVIELVSGEAAWAEQFLFIAASILGQWQEVCRRPSPDWSVETGEDWTHRSLSEATAANCNYIFFHRQYISTLALWRQPSSEGFGHFTVCLSLSGSFGLRHALSMQAWQSAPSYFKAKTL